MKLIVDCETNQEVFVELTPDEIAQREQMAKELEQQQLAEPSKEEQIAELQRQLKEMQEKLATLL